MLRHFFKKAVINSSKIASKRSIVSARELEGLPVFKSSMKHLSPVQGVVLDATNTTKYMHLTNKLDGFKQFKSYNYKLVDNMFNIYNDKLRATNLKSLPAYSLTPDVLAKIIYNLEINKLHDDATQDEIIKSWKNNHVRLAGPSSKLSTGKIKKLLKLIELSKLENLSQDMPEPYFASMTSAILMNFLILKANSLEDLMLYVDTLNDLYNVKSTKNKTIQKTSIDHLISKVNSLARSNDNEFKDIVNEDYENILLNFVLLNNSLQKVGMQDYAVGRGEKRPSCIESSYHNICNLILFNSITKKFDFSLLPSSVKINPKLKEFYEDQHLSIENVCSYNVGQEFYNLVSGIDGVAYRQDFYEIIARKTGDDFIKVMNFLFGTNAENLDELSKIFSNDKRQFEFCKDDSCIDVKIYQKNNKPIHMTLAYSRADHGIFTENSLLVSGSEFMFDTILTNSIDNLWKNKDKINPLFFSGLNFFTSNRLVIGGTIEEKKDLLQAGLRAKINAEYLTGCSLT